MEKVVSPNKLLLLEAKEAMERFYEDDSVPVQETLEGLQRLEKKVASLIRTLHCFCAYQILDVSQDGWEVSPSGELTKRKV